MASNPESKKPQDTELLESTVTTPKTKLNVKRGKRKRRSSGDNLNSEMVVSVFKTILYKFNYNYTSLINVLSNFCVCGRAKIG